MAYDILAYDDLRHRNQVILWQEVFGYEAAHNAPDHYGYTIPPKFERVGLQPKFG